MGREDGKGGAGGYGEVKIFQAESRAPNAEGRGAVGNRERALSLDPS